jgi:hypothetical protein
VQGACGEATSAYSASNRPSARRGPGDCGSSRRSARASSLARHNRVESRRRPRRVGPPLGLARPAALEPGACRRAPAASRCRSRSNTRRTPRRAPSLPHGHAEDVYTSSLRVRRASSAIHLKGPLCALALAAVLVRRQLARVAQVRHQRVSRSPPSSVAATSARPRDSTARRRARQLLGLFLMLALAAATASSRLLLLALQRLGTRSWAHGRASRGAR